jgi:DNA helicase-2/ATP-dependent DNA helicase PcrA
MSYRGCDTEEVRGMPAAADPRHLLAGLTDEQSAAAQAVSGPVVIHAGAGTGKTRVLTHRAAYAAAIGAMDPRTALMVTFTKKAADEMAERLRPMGVAGATASTFHATAWRQLRYFWPQLHGEELQILDNPWQAVNPMVRGLPGRYRFTPTRDVLETIAWMKSRRVAPDQLEAAAEAAGRPLPVPSDLMGRIYRRYEEGKAQRNLVDFEDLILRCTDMLTGSPEVRQEVQARYRWFSVDEFQDTNPAQYGLLQLWLGDSRDLCVVGDENQTIYTFTGATSRYLTGFEREFAGARSFRLTLNHRSTPQILQPANALVRGADPLSLQLRAATADGPQPLLHAYPDEAAECRGIADQVRRWADAGIPLNRIAVLVRLNADTPPIEAALASAGLPFRVKGRAFFQRREVSDAVAELARSAPAEGESVLLWSDRVFRDRLGYSPDEEPATPEQRERQAALTALQQIVTELGEAADHAGIISDLRRRADAETAGTGEAVELATLHAAKGLEWEAVILPGLEQGHLPVQQALKDQLLLDEERRLLYVGITRARGHLVMSWAQSRPVAGKGDRPRTRSTFLASIDPTPDRRSGTGGGRGRRPVVTGSTHDAGHGPTADGSRRRTGGRRIDAAPGSDEYLFERLRQWRRGRAQSDGVPAYIVLSDSSLWLIARHRPDSPDQLADIHGVGPTKLQRYGSEILAVVAEERSAD